jgi:cyclophilin family peptidyl-prolyl cis-trans isomerase
MSRIFVFTLSLCFALNSLRAQDTAPATDEAAAPAAEQPAESEPAAPAEQPATEVPQPSAEAAAAKKDFDALAEKWSALVANINKTNKELAAAQPDQRAALDEQISTLRNEADDLLNKITDAGLAVYRADPKAFPPVNHTLLFIAQHHLAGNAEGDGGDQYEKALPLIKNLIDAGAAAEHPELYTWGAVAAYATNDFAQAKEYFAKAEETGSLSDSPPSGNPADPRFRIWETARNFSDRLTRVSSDWEKEKEIRAAEEKADDLPRVKLTTTKGDIVLELYENEAPQSVASFLTLVKDGFYDGVVFHRVLPGFMAQGGDPTGTGSGGPGYSIRCECYKPNYRHHFRGTLSMAHAGRDTGGSQFFLTFVPTPSLDGRHTAFGRVVEGMDVVANLKRIDPEAPSRPTPDRIVKAEVLRDRGHEYKFDKLPER